MGAVTPSAPVPLAPEHELDTFDSGAAALDDWLKRRARGNEAGGASRTFVVCVGRRVIGYYSLAAGSLMHAGASGKVRRNMPEPVPVVLLGRLAIDREWQGKGLASDLLRDAVLRITAAASTIGARAILVHAISPAAKAFYEWHGFRASPVDPMMLMVTVEDARNAVVRGAPAAKA
jgi:GNAT superfamily N-acetyltransferase